jgi:Helix-turn-helix.
MDGSIKKKMTISFSENLITLRGDKTLKEVSDGIGIDAQSLSRYEKGERIPNVDIAKDIADYYGVSLDALYGDFNEKPKDFMLLLCYYTGLSKDSIRYVKLFLDNNGFSKTLDKIILSDRFGELITYLSQIEKQSNDMLTLESKHHKRDSLDDIIIDGLRDKASKIFDSILDTFDARIEKENEFESARETAQVINKVFVEEQIKRAPVLVKLYEDGYDLNQLINNESDEIELI